MEYEFEVEEGVCMEYVEIVSELFENLRQVKKLTVGKWCRMTTMEKWDLPGIASLLQSSPYVETLVIDIISRHPRYTLPAFRIRSYDEVNHWKSKEVYFKSLLQYLKTIKIFGFRKSFHPKKVFILVVEFLLKNAKILEKMVITEPRLI
ncbi:hypothetical protein CFP56_041509 [Quercus suber]|uniref:FBD domain-containing protein n=1 Tax=Quercus suber TaxID=58331 RepID=A0AAW0IVD2_QUESU